MARSDAASLAQYLTDRYGLPLTGTHRHDAIELRPADIHPHEGFLINVREGWRSVGVELVPGRFARELVHAMGDADASSRAAFAALVSAAVTDRGTIRMMVNDASAAPDQPDTWPSPWQKLHLSIQSPPVDPDVAGPEWAAELSRHWAGRLLAMTLALAATAIEETEVRPLDVSGLPEGALTRVEVNRYERSRTNRAVCIEVHGTRCRVCEFDFGAVYGELGAGFIHVHHVVPVSRMDGAYRVNPVQDLVPVCPNCHAMIHRQDPPLSVAALQVILRQAGGRSTPTGARREPGGAQNPV